MHKYEPDFSKAYVEIIEQPAPKALRFRYECEGRSAGSILGASSTDSIRTYPKIKIHGYKGTARVVVSCVTKEEPYRPHPHNLVGKNGCEKGICKIEINNDDMIATFENLGIQCTRIVDVEASLQQRKDQKINPFCTDDNGATAKLIKLNAIRLCFQVFIKVKNVEADTMIWQPLKPVVSNAILDKKSYPELIITEISDQSSPVGGGRKIILLCDKVVSTDISIKFSRKDSKGRKWESIVEHKVVHNQHAIVFNTPKYCDQDIDVPVKVYMQLIRPSDKAESEYKEFEYQPLLSNVYPERKRKRMEEQKQVSVEESKLHMPLFNIKTDQSTPSPPANPMHDQVGPSHSHIPNDHQRSSHSYQHPMHRIPMPNILPSNYAMQMGIDRPLQPMEPPCNKPNIFYQQPFNYTYPCNLEGQNLVTSTAPYNSQQQITSMEQQYGALGGGYRMDNAENMNSQWNIGQQNMQPSNVDFSSAPSGYLNVLRGSSGYNLSSQHQQLQGNTHSQQQLLQNMLQIQSMNKENHHPSEYVPQINTNELCDNLIDLEEVNATPSNLRNDPLDFKSNNFHNL